MLGAWALAWGGGSKGAELGGLRDEGQGIQVIVVASGLGDGEGHHLIGAELVDGGACLMQQLAALVVGVGVVGLGVDREAAVVERFQETASERAPRRSQPQPPAPARATASDAKRR